MFSLIDDLEKEARTQGHKEVVQIAHLARLSGMIRQRRWDSLLKAFEESAQVLDSPSDSAATSNPPSHSDQVFLFHFLILRALVQGRAGQDDEARQNLKRLYRLMDSASGTKAMKRLREDGGLLRVRSRKICCC